MNLSIREFVYYKLDGLVAKSKMDRVSMVIAEWISEQYVHPHGRQVANLREANAALRRQVDELRQALETVKPFVLRWHDKIMSLLVGEATDKCERQADKQAAWELYRRFEDEQRNLKEIIETALARAEAPGSGD